MSDWHGKRVVVAGGAGFIGHHLSYALLAAKAKVAVVDDLSTGNAIRIGSLTVADIATLDRLPINAEIIFNLACPASPRAYQADPVQTWRTSVIGTWRLAHLAQEAGVRIIQASTSEVYGDPLVHPQKEDYSGNVALGGPRAC